MVKKNKVVPLNDNPGEKESKSSYKNTRNKEIQNKELVRCINTISFVIRHMYEELNNLCLYSNRDDHDKFHYIKTNNQKKFNNTKVRAVDI